jgi:hypothetical protein
MAPSRWIEQYTLRSQAIQNAYAGACGVPSVVNQSTNIMLMQSFLSADFNADCVAGTLTPSPLGSCTLQPLVSTSAFASRTFDGVPVDPVQCVPRSATRECSA